MLLAATIALAGCAQRTGDAIVTGKEHVAPVQEGATPDSRATSEHQWIVNVEMISGGRKIAVRVDQAQWEKINTGDRVIVSYSEGKYTGTVWGAEIKK